MDSLVWLIICKLVHLLFIQNCQPFRALLNYALVSGIATITKSRNAFLDIG